MLSDTRNTKKDKICRFTTEQMVINTIIYGPVDRMDNMFVLGFDDDGQTSSLWLSVGDLVIVYEELLKTVRHE